MHPEVVDLVATAYFLRSLQLRVALVIAPRPPEDMQTHQEKNRMSLYNMIPGTASSCGLDGFFGTRGAEKPTPDTSYAF